MGEVNDVEEDDGDVYPPWNFSWVDHGKLAAMACPAKGANLRFLLEQGITHLVTLSSEKRPPSHLCNQLKYTDVFVKEFQAPTVKQINAFIDICQRCSLSNDIGSLVINEDGSISSQKNFETMSPGTESADSFDELETALPVILRRRLNSKREYTHLPNFHHNDSDYVVRHQLDKMKIPSPVLDHRLSQTLGHALRRICRSECIENSPSHWSTYFLNVKHAFQVVGVHCRMGRGRAGVMGACYLVRFKEYTPERAISTIRINRPGSIESYEQEKIVHTYFDCVRGTATKVSDL